MALTKAEKQIRELKSKVEELEKKLKDCEESKERAYEEKRKLDEEIADLHAMLDEFPNAPARERKISSWNTTTLSLQSRLSAWFGSVFIASTTNQKFPMEKLPVKECD